MMYVCKKCHEKDRITTHCEKPISDHAITHAPSGLADGCDVCGRKGILYICSSYKTKGGKKCENYYCS